MRRERKVNANHQVLWFGVYFLLSVGLLSSGPKGRSGFATRAVIGTLRPTERRRATSFSRHSCRNADQPAELGHHGAEGSRTPDLCSAIAALSQLSYSP
jgi:hypothetical protein